ncbi:MAG TPA: polysaccharide biosynthesis C-terminal domain-containing protein [Flavisolibacter sp.]
MINYITTRFAGYFAGRLSAIKEISAFTLSNVINTVIVFIALGFYLKRLPPDEYGKAIFFSLLVSLFAPLVSVNSNSYFWTKYFDHGTEGRARMYSSAYLFIIAMSVFWTLLVLVTPFNAVLPVNLDAFIIFIPAAACLTMISEDVKNLLIYQKKLREYVIVNNGITLVENLLIIILVYNVSATYTSRIAAWLLVLGATFFIHFYFFAVRNKYLVPRVHRDTLRSATAFGFPLMFQQWSKMVLNSADRWFLAGIVSVYQMGIYNLGYQIGSMVSTLITGYINFLTPVLYNKLSLNDHYGFHRIRKSFFLFLVLLVFAVVALYILFLLFSKPLLGENYYESAPFIVFAGIATITFAFTIPYSSALAYRGKTRHLAAASMITLLLNLGLNYLLIREYLTFGAAYSTVISYLFLTLLIYYFYRKVYAPVPAAGSQAAVNDNNP